MKKLEIQYVDIKKLVPWDKNPRKNDKAAHEVARSIEEGNFDQPILVDHNYRICKGHTRWKAAKLLELKVVPVLQEYMEEKEFIERALSDNKTAELARWDAKLLKESMTILDGIGPIELPGWKDDEIDKIFGHKHIETHTDAEADFGEDGRVKVESETEGDARVKRVVFLFSPKNYEVVSSKLKAIKKEHGLDDQAQALIEALRPYKGLPVVTRKAGPVTEIDGDN